MSKRKAISKKLRFEVFKRDSFICQYCGQSAPDVVLHIDHIEPVAKGGSNDITNLITACFDCNMGKKDRKISDDSVVKKSKKQLDELNEKRIQIEMVADWRKELLSIEEIQLDAINDILDLYSQRLSEFGRKTVRKRLKKYGFNEVYESFTIAYEEYTAFKDGEYTKESLEKAFGKVDGILYNRKQKIDNPNVMKVFYIRGILRNRININERTVIPYLNDAIARGWDVAQLEQLAKDCTSWADFDDTIRHIIGYSENG